MRLEASDLSFSYGGRKVLDRTSFSLQEEGMTALLGRNGSGKSTLLKLLLGFLRPDEGKVLIDGNDASSLRKREKARIIAYIPQESHPVYSLSVKDMVLLGRAPLLPAYSRPGRKDEEIAMNVLLQLGIQHLSARPVTRLSGGERQLVIIARALAQEARLLLLDEPTSSLDYSNRLMVLDKLGELSEKGYSVLFSTHNPEEALLAGSRLMTLSEGKVSLLTKEDITRKDVISRLYGRKIIITEVDTGEHRRPICVPL